MAGRPIRRMPREQEPQSLILPHLTAPLVSAAGPYGSDAGSQGEGHKAWTEMSWAYYESIGELNQAYTWFSNSMSRVRFFAAEKGTDSSEPVPLESGPAVDIMQQISWDMPHILKMTTLDKLVVGRAYLVGRELSPNERTWRVYSPEQIRVSSKLSQARRSDASAPVVYELWEDGKRWIEIPEALVVPLRTEDARLSFLDSSPTKSNLGILREIDLLNRKIVAAMVSRIASRGILFGPTEVGFGTRSEHNDNRDPFYAQLLEVAAQAMKDPGSASAALPLVLKVPAGMIEKFRWLSFDSGIVEKTLDERKAALERLADGLPLPREFVTGGMGDVNHWSGWLMEETAIKIYIAPFATELARNLTTGFLYPQLAAANQRITNGNNKKIVVWFDTSELAADPDLSKQGQSAFDALQIGPDPYLRSQGFTEDDIPTSDELKLMMLLKMIQQPANAQAAYEEITGAPLAGALRQQEAEATQRAAQVQQTRESAEDRSGPPDTEDDEPEEGP